ncbi:MAG: flagellar basal body L-ring protein FlgH, partial [Verrucomicrobiota bacterium]
MKKSLQRLTPLLLLLAPACSRPKAETLAPVLAQEPPPIGVVTSPAQELPIPRYLLVTGELKAARQAMLAPDASGKVVAAPIERGSVVREGDVILKLDDRAATHALKESEASLADARLKLNWAQSETTRNASMVKSQGISAAEFERVTLNRGDEHIRISGIVRPADIGFDNRVSSTRVADAHITYSGNGE